jgi:hypothetical protein
VPEQIQRYVRIGLYRVFEGFGGLLRISCFAVRSKGARVGPLSKDVFFVTLEQVSQLFVQFFVQ